ncbi:MAG: putative lipid II flippase FtsW [Candidatus Magasanikbacteria bacterium]
MRVKKQIQKKADVVLFIYFLGLIFFGLIMLASASSVIGYTKFADNYFFVKRQIMYGFLPGMVLLLTCAKIPYEKYKKMMYPIFAGMILILVAVFIPGIGQSFNTGSKSWVQLFGFSFQPAEFAKLGMILFFSAYLAEKGKTLLNFKEGFFPSLIMGMIPVLLIILQPDIGTVFILFSIVFSLLFIAGAKSSHLSSLALTGIIAFILLIIAAPYRAARLTTFLHPELDPLGVGYHINQAYLAIGSGGIFGLGLGHSQQKFQYLPEVHADSIFAVMAEELGFLIVGAFLFFLVIIAFRMLAVSRRVSDPFGKYVIFGIVIWFMVQSFMNIGAMLGLMPLTGVPLPFVSHGGTALMIAMGAIGIVLNISKEST